MLQIGLAVLVAFVTHHIQLLLLLLQRTENRLFRCLQTSVVDELSPVRLLALNDGGVTGFVDLSGGLSLDHLAN